MSRTCLFVLCFILGIAVRFSDCENNILGDDTNCAQSALGSDETRLSHLEKILKKLRLPIDAVSNRRSNTLREESFSSVLEKASNYGVIFPGTLWCGDGDRAKNADDLGRFDKTDACCRAHDNCKNDLLAGDTEVNLKNNGIFTRSACSCDFEFYNCLKKANSLLSKGIGNTYFNILRPQCFRCICPIDKCDPNTETACKGQCLKYEWVDNSKF